MKIILLFLLVSSLTSRAQCPPSNAFTSTTTGARIFVSSTGVSSNIVQEAMGMWNDCGNTVPEFSTSSGTISVNILMFSGSDPTGSLAHTGISMLDGSITGATIYLYPEDGAGHVFSDAELLGIITHELGHTLGLGDNMASSCLMGPAPNNADGSYDMSAKIVQSWDCEEAGDLWATPTTPDRPDCIPDRKNLKGSIGDCNSPLVIDLEGDGFSFGGEETTVWFDLYGVGIPISIQWVRPNEDNAFLVHDINGDGLLNDGSELFGSGTRMILLDNVFSPDGFVALGQHDNPELGGNDDGYITENDLIWEFLFLWIDKNGDGISTQEEMSLLKDSTLTKLEIRPKKSPAVDAHGNQLKLWGWVIDENAHKRFRMVDVFFKEVEP